MHVVQIMLVEADSALDALDTVSSHLSENEPTWSDWHNAFGQGSFAGRWKGHYFGADNTLDVLCYGDDAALAEKAISEALGYRTTEIANLRKLISEKGVDIMNVEYDPYASFPNNPIEGKPHLEKSMAIYYNYKLSQLLNDNWTGDTAIFDLTNWDANLAGFRERVAKNPENQYLVVVDFHH
jgi:hypothetical protein